MVWTINTKHKMTTQEHIIPALVRELYIRFMLLSISLKKIYNDEIMDDKYVLLIIDKFV